MLETSDQLRTPFRNGVIACVCWSALQALLQIRYPSALGYGDVVVLPRPLWALVFMGGQGLLLLLIVAIAGAAICDEERKKSPALFWLGAIAAVGAWLGVMAIAAHEHAH